MIKLYMRVYLNFGSDIEIFVEMFDVIFFLGGVFVVNVILCELVIFFE